MPRCTVLSSCSVSRASTEPPPGPKALPLRSSAALQGRHTSRSVCALPAVLRPHPRTFSGMQQHYSLCLLLDFFFFFLSSNPSQYAFAHNDDGVLYFYAQDGPPLPLLRSPFFVAFFFFRIMGIDPTKKPLFHVPSLRDYYKSLNDVLNYTSLGPCKTISFKYSSFNQFSILYFSLRDSISIFHVVRAL